MLCVKKNKSHICKAKSNWTTSGLIEEETWISRLGPIYISLQSKPLQAFHDGEFSSLGENECVNVDTRVITATKEDLEWSTEAGLF